MMRGFYGPGSNFLAQGNFMWMGLFSMIIQLLFWVVVIYIAVKLFKKYSNGLGDSKVTEDTAMAILRERFAKGEIDAEEFRLRKTQLE